MCCCLSSPNIFLSCTIYMFLFFFFFFFVIYTMCVHIIILLYFIESYTPYIRTFWDFGGILKNLWNKLISSILPYE